MQQTSKKIRILSIGSALRDIITVINSSLIERMTLHNSSTSYLLLQPGNKIEAKTVTTNIGGGAVNCAVSFKKLGCKVDVIAKLGKDKTAEEIYQYLEKCGIGTKNILQTETEGTGMSVLLSSHDGNAAVFTMRGANGHIKKEEIEKVDFTQYDAVYIANLSDSSAKCYPYIVQKAKNAGLFVVSNPGIRQISSRTTELVESIRKVDLLALNFREAAALAPSLSTNLEAKNENHDNNFAKCMTSGGFSITVGDFLKTVIRGGTKSVVITDGVNGSYYTDNNCIVKVPIITPLKAVSTAGAGDAFNSTLAVVLLKKMALYEALCYAAYNASKILCVSDTQSALLSFSELNNIPESVKEKFEQRIIYKNLF